MDFLKCIGGILGGGIMLSTMIIIGTQMVDPKRDPIYKLGVLDTKREAFNHGFMTKEVNEKDEVIYRWLEAHKYNEQ